MSSERAPRDPRPTWWHLPALGVVIAVALALALVVRDPWVGAAAVVVGVLNCWGVLRHRDETGWSDRGWRQLERLSPELVGQLDERAILRVALADGPTLLRAEMVQVFLHPVPGADAVVATQLAQGGDDVEIRELRPGDAALPVDAALAIALPGPGAEVGTLVVHGGRGRDRHTRRRLAQGLAHLVASSVAAARIHERQRTLADDLYRSALRDDVTVLGNRSLLHERGSQQLARSMAQRKSAALLLIDLDDFKRVNDTLGHRVGDQLLAEVGRRIRHQVRDTDLAVRLGGDEFVVLASELAAPDDADLLADRLLAAIAEPVRLDGIELHLTGSLGIAVHGEDADSLEGLIVVADQAMYQAKAEGRARWRRRTRPSGWTDALLDRSHGVPEHELELHYQPQVASNGGGVVGFEVLTRWRHPELGLLGPEEFLPELERRSLSSQLTVDVLQRALADLPLLRERAPGATVSVNVSARDLLRLDLVTTVGDVLAAHGASGTDLVLEMMEPAPALSATLDSVLSGLRSLGCLVSIHEFGTGQSSLAALSSHPAIAEVKIAPRLVSTVLTDERALRLVRVAVDCAHGLGLRVVAEGVETAEVAVALNELGCDRLQGSRLGEAASARDVGAAPWPTLSPAR
jgi:diguanylate cyclase